MSENEKDEIIHMFVEAVETFPPEHQKVAKDWLFEAAAALEYIDNLKNGVLL
jgi:hypothetical protein